MNHVYGTAAALPALEAMGIRGDDARVLRAVEWLRAHQNEDGGWGEDCRSYVDREWIGRGESTASQTAWALIALHAAGHPRDEMVERGLALARLDTSARTAAGTSPSTRAPASPATSTSTTTCTGSCSR